MSPPFGLRSPAGTALNERSHAGRGGTDKSHAAGHWTDRTSRAAHSIARVTSRIALDFYDAELRAHHEHLRGAYEISPGDEVLDIGCGAGLTTRETARAAAPGRVVGVDVSERMIERARQLT